MGKRRAMMARIASDFVPPTSSAAELLSSIRFTPPAPEPPAAVAEPPAEAPGQGEPTLLQGLQFAEPPAPPVEDPTDPLLQLREFVKVTGGSHPFPRSREQWAALPPFVQLEISARLPTLAEQLSADDAALPAYLQLALAEGDDALAGLSRDDLATIEAAGYPATALRIRNAHLGRMKDHVDAGTLFRAAPPDLAAIQAEADVQRQRSLSKFQTRTQRAALLKSRAGA